MQTATIAARSTPVVLAPLTMRMPAGITALPRVLETIDAENLIGLGMIPPTMPARRAECFTNDGVIALIAKQKAPAKGVSCAPMVAPLTWLPTLAYSIDSTPRPHMLVPIVADALGAKPRKNEMEDMTKAS